MKLTTIAWKSKLHSMEALTWTKLREMQGSEDVPLCSQDEAEGEIRRLEDRINSLHDQIRGLKRGPEHLRDYRNQDLGDRVFGGEYD